VTTRRVLVDVRQPPRKRPADLLIDLTGLTFGRLLVVERGTGPRAKWVCRCECGNVVEVQGGNLRSGNTRSCGCLRRERITRTPSFPN
jgi:hypothetical protein